jgi:hypothetical protein
LRIDGKLSPLRQTRDRAHFASVRQTEKLREFSEADTGLLAVALVEGLQCL